MISSQHKASGLRDPVPQPTAKIASDSDGSSRLSSPGGTAPRFPAGEHEWEALRPVIEELYVTRNLPLRGVVHHIRTEYGFKARHVMRTPAFERMYKTRLTRWGMRKSSEAKAVQSTRLGRQVARQIGGGSRSSTPGSIAIYAPSTRLLMHESRTASYLDAALRGFRSFNVSWAETDPRWREISRYKSDSLSVQQFPLKDNLRMATSYLESGDYPAGGRFLRLAFLAIEEVLMDDHISSATDLFVACPLMIFKLQQPLRDEIIKAYSKYLYQQSSIIRKAHPIAAVARSLHEAASVGGMQRVISVISKLVRLQYDTYVRLRGLDVASANKLSVYAHGVQDRDLQLQSMGNFMTIARQASAELGEDNIDARVLWGVALTLRADLELFDDTFRKAAERLCTTCAKMYKCYREKPPEIWVYDYYENWIYRSGHFLLMKYWLAKGGLDQVIEHSRAAVQLNGAPDGVWKMFAAAVEKLLRARGLLGEADRLAERRRELDMTPEVREALEKEEASELSVIANQRTSIKEEKGTDEEDTDDEDAFKTVSV
ncbi:hypothetical protein JX265_002521 [Neoarthrinium moseri]|uniref:Clr5 domain-containing protein n=1 Tax=Neoarthrinium moseri TaxID=1658444 RepID=A0A9Q0ATK6_9PEZI|nr:hypothetical protein JX266_001000 [Neoarthrinium moseri]KAI1879567.1 hypothetical protein JX265_002521 [Neoarthrinium moseri]